MRAKSILSILIKVIDRTHLKAILHEHKLASTGLIDPQTARQLGRIAGVDALVTGTLTPLGDSVRLSAKVLDTETATMIAASTVNVPKTKAIEELLSRGIGSQQSANVGSGSTAGASTSSLPKPTGSLPSFETDIFRLVVTSLRKTARFLEVVITAESKGNETVRFKLGRGPSMPWSYNYQLLDESGNSVFAKSDTAGFVRGLTLYPGIRRTTRIVFQSEGTRGTTFTLVAYEFSPKRRREIVIPGIR